MRAFIVPPRRNGRFFDNFTSCWLHFSRQVTDVQFSPDGYILASAAADGQVKLWDLRAGKPMHTFQASATIDSSWQETSDQGVLLCLVQFFLCCASRLSDAAPAKKRQAPSTASTRALLCFRPDEKLRTLCKRNVIKIAYLYCFLMNVCSAFYPMPR